MKLYRGIDSYDGGCKTVVTVGSFDGVHSGHTSLLTLLRDRALSTGAQSVVVSFSPHPRVTLGRAEGLKLLTSDREKEHLLDLFGVDSLLLLEFDRPFSRLSYEEFVVDYLLHRLNMVELVVGFNHHMGHNGGDYNKLNHLASKHNFKVTLAKEYSTGEKISSTRIRELVECGDIERANELLSHNYPLFGRVSSVGELMSDEPLKLIPSEGRYRASVDNTLQVITIDEQRRVWCNEKDKDIEIKLEGRV